MHKWLIPFGLLLLLGGAFIWLQSGPRAAVPTVDPLVRWNAEHADLVDNAANLYQLACDRLVGEPDYDWSIGRQFPGDPIPTEAEFWVEQNAEAITLTRSAAARANCWFMLQRADDGTFLMPHLSQLRTPARLLQWCALAAVQRHDLATLADSILAGDRIARHADVTPTLIAALVGIALRAYAQEVILQPLLWPELSADDRAAYLSRLAPVFEPPPDLAAAFAGDQELDVWMYGSSIRGWGATCVAPASRFAGEMERYHAPLRELATAPVERQCDPADPLAMQLQVMEDEQTSKLNMPRMLASFFFSSQRRVLSIRSRLIATQRGNRTVLELFAFRDCAGAFPETLDQLSGEFITDPFTGRPFIYRRTPSGGFTLYSAGLDRDDDGGRHDARFGEGAPACKKGGRPDGDFVFWPIPGSSVTATQTSQP